MDCEQAREAVSALLDDEDPGPAHAEVEEHLHCCPECRQWRQQATRVTRLARVAPVEPGVDVTEQVLGTVTLRGRTPTRGVLRLALLLVALAQVAVGAGGLLAGTDSALVGGHGHISHELGAFNLGVGAALLWAAIRPRSVAGPLPMLAAFVLVLAVTSLLDVAGGHVGWQRLATHLPVVAGMVLVAVLCRLQRSDTTPDDGAIQPVGGDPHAAPTTQPEPTPPAAPGPHGGAPPAARRRESA